MVKSFHSCAHCSGSRGAYKEEPEMKKSNAIHKIPGVDGGFEGFNEESYARIQNHVVGALESFAGKRLTPEIKAEIEKIALDAVQDVCADELKIYWNSTDHGRVSFTLYPAATTYDPKFAPGCTITLA